MTIGSHWKLSSHHRDPNSPSLPEVSLATVSETLVQVGSVINAHGNYGKLRVAPTTSNPKRFDPGNTLQIAGRAYTVEESGVGPNGTILLLLKETHSREDALRLMGEVISVHIADVPQSPEGTYYHFQLIGLNVMTIDEESLGMITEVIETGANDVYVVQTQSTEWLIPAIPSVVLDVDLEAGSMRIALPHGLEVRHIRQPRTKRRIGFREHNAKKQAR